MNEGLRREGKLQARLVETPQNLKVDLVGNVGPVLPFANEVNRADVQAEVAKPTEPHGVLVFRAACVRHNLCENAKGFFDLVRRGVVRQPQHHLHLSRGLGRHIFHNLVGELVVGNGHEAVFEGLDAGRPNANFLNGAVDAVDFDAVARSKRLVNEHSDAPEDVGHEVFGGHGHGQTTNANTCKQSPDIVPCVGQPGDDAKDPHQ